MPNHYTGGTWSMWAVDVWFFSSGYGCAMAIRDRDSDSFQGSRFMPHVQEVLGLLKGYFFRPEIYSISFANVLFFANRVYRQHVSANTQDWILLQSPWAGREGENELTRHENISAKKRAVEREKGKSLLTQPGSITSWKSKDSKHCGGRNKSKSLRIFFTFFHLPLSSPIVHWILLPRSSPYQAMRYIFH